MSALGNIRRREAAATEGPWDVKECGPCTARGRLDVGVWANDGDTEVAGWCDDDEFTRPDAEFIAHARTEIPRLLAALDAVEDQLRWFDAAIANNPDVKVSARVAARRIRTAINDALEANA